MMARRNSRPLSEINLLLPPRPERISVRGRRTRRIRGSLTRKIVL